MKSCKVQNGRAKIGSKVRFLVPSYAAKTDLIVTGFAPAGPDGIIVRARELGTGNPRTSFARNTRLVEGIERLYHKSSEYGGDPS